MDDYTSYFEIPRNLERYLATVSKFYAQENQRLLQQIVVNARPRVSEGKSYNTMDGNDFGHHVHLGIPEALFITILSRKHGLEKKIKDDLNHLHNVHDEFIDEVFFEMEVPSDYDWRSESGLLINGERQVSPNAVARIWETDNYRVFLSHKSNSKEETAHLKDRLKLFGICAFVAHQDIHPTKQWQDEIEQALASMDAFVALMTPDFHESDWTDQEVGYAFARGVPIIAINLGRVPYGFIGKFQALKTTWDDAPAEIAKLSMKHERMLSAYIEALGKCPNFGTGNELSKALPSITALTSTQVDRMIATYNDNYELFNSFGFNGSRPKEYGLGLIYHLRRLDSGRKFDQIKFGKINVVKQ